MQVLSSRGRALHLSLTLSFPEGLQGLFLGLVILSAGSGLGQARGRASTKLVTWPHGGSPSCRVLRG